MKHCTGIERQCALLGDAQWIHFDLRNPSLLHRELAKANDDVFEGREIDRSPASLALKRCVDPSLLNELARERSIERRQRQRSIAEHFHE
jgi:hypothetical protein